jgi:putative ABC transport system permease protein
MVKNFFKVAFRNMVKQKFFSLINVLGLSIGIAASLFVVLYIVDELSYDLFHTDIEKIYRLDLTGRLNGQEIETTNSSPPVALAMVAEIPEIESSVRIQELSDVIVTVDEESFIEVSGIFFADSNFFEFFDFVLLEGDAKSVLNQPNTVVLTQKMATKYFGDEPAIGKQLVLFNSKTVYKVTGVAANPPSNSHFHFTTLITTVGEDRFNSESWFNNSFQSYVKGFQVLDDMPVVNNKIRVLTLKYAGPQLEQIMGATFEQFEAQGNAYGYSLRPVKEIHLYSDNDDEIEAGGDIKYVYLFGAIGLFIILIACINFMNLSTAKSSGRAKEVGLRKTLGSARNQLTVQFLFESLIFAVISGLIAVVMVFILFPAFNSFAGKSIDVSQLWSLPMMATAFGVTLIVGLLAGSYPAFYLTSFNPADVLKGRVSTGARSGKLRGGLVVAQFTISIILIICTTIVYQQLTFTQDKNLGFEKSNTIVILNTARLETDNQAFKQNLEQQSSIFATSYTNNVFPGVNNTTIFREFGADVDHIMGNYFGDYDHVEALGYSLVEGRPFSREFLSDSTGALVNEAVVKEMDWDNPIGEKIVFLGNNEPTNLTVVGVLKDFHFESLHLDIRPIVIQLTQDANRMVVRFNDETDPRSAVELVQAEWEKLAPNELFQYQFMDDNFDALYRSEQKLGQIFYLFTGIAIFIACLGLLGLSAFVAEQRTKEIGIRKALGASMVSISTLLSKEFAKYVLIAIILAIYPAYYIMSDWLSGFAYRIDISAWIFVLSGATALIIALLTVSFQAIRASRVNPVNSLKYE